MILKHKLSYLDVVYSVLGAKQRVKNCFEWVYFLLLSTKVYQASPLNSAKPKTKLSNNLPNNYSAKFKLTLIYIIKPDTRQNINYLTEIFKASNVIHSWSTHSRISIINCSIQKNINSKTVYYLCCYDFKKEKTPFLAFLFN